MATLARLFDFQSGQPILSNDVDSEFNQLVNALNGTATGTNLIVRYNAAGDPPLKLDQIGAGPIQQWAQAGLVNATITNQGNLQISNNAPQISLIDSNDTKEANIVLTGNSWLFVNATAGTFPMTVDMVGSAVTFSAIPVLPASNPTTANQAVRKQFIDDRTVFFERSWFYGTPPGATETAPSVDKFITPNATAYTVTSILVVFSGGSHTNGGTLTWTLKRQDPGGGALGDLGTISLSDTNNTVNVVYANDIVDVVLGAADQVFPLLTTRSGSITETNITVTIQGFQKFS